MKTTLQTAIETIASSPNEVLTKYNVLHLLNGLLQTEREQLASVANVNFVNHKQGRPIESGEAIISRLFT